MFRRLKICVPLSCALLLASGNSFGHAVIDEMVKPANTLQFVDVRITHGCGAAATNKVSVKIPEGIGRVSPAYKAGWKISTTMRKLAVPVTDHGITSTETVDTVVWEGGNLPDGMYDTFQIRAAMPNDEGGVYRFKTVQECVDGGTIRWIQEPAEGQSPWDLEKPAPFIELSAPVKQY